MDVKQRETERERLPKKERRKREREGKGEREGRKKRGETERGRGRGRMKSQQEEDGGREGGREIHVPEMWKGCTEKGKILILLSFSIIKILNYLKVCLKIGRTDEENKTVKSS